MIPPDFKPLRGIRIVDLTRLLPGPLATLILSDLGAEVIKVEEPAGDPMRALPPLVDGTSATFHALNRGKRFVSLDLRDPVARERLLRLVARADCVVEGFRPGVLPRLGLDPAEAIRSFPGLLIARISGFGQHGPWLDRPGHDLSYLALTGVLDRAPTPLPLPIQAADVGAALLAATAIAAGLAGRARGDREGRVLDLPILDAALLMAFPTQARQAGGDDPAPGVGLLEGGLPVYKTYPDADGRGVAVASLEPATAAALAGLFGGLDHQTLAAGFASRPRAALDVGSGWPPGLEPVLTLAEAREHPAIRERGTFRTMASDGGQSVHLPVTPFAASGPIADGLWARAIGADNDTVLD